MADRIILFGSDHRIRVDDTANYYYIEFYNTTTSTWETVLQIDTANKAILVFPTVNTTLNADSINVVNNATIGSSLTYKGAVLINKSVAPTLGTGGNLGAEVDITPNTGYNGIVPILGYITVGGTLATGETITIQVTAYYSDGTSNSITKTASATGTITLSAEDLASLIKDGVYITKIGVAAGSSATSTSATVSAVVAGLEH